MFRKHKPFPWFWIAVGMLLFCAVVYLVSRMFQRSVSKEINGKRLYRAMRKPAMSDELFV
jgi:hypothetical protein